MGVYKCLCAVDVPVFGEVVGVICVSVCVCLCACLCFFVEVTVRVPVCLWVGVSV